MSEESRHWADEKEVIKTNIPLKITLLLIKHMPFFVVRIFIFPVSVFYCIFAKTARKSAIEYQKQLRNFTGRKIPPHISAYRQILSFAFCIIEKMEGWLGKIKFDRIQYQNDDIDDIMTFLKQNGKTITFYFIQTKKTENINWASFLNLIDVPLTIWRGNEFPKSQPHLKKIQDFIDEVTDDSLKITHKIAILFYTNKNKNDIEQLKNDWSVNINNKKTELAEYFSKSNIEIEFRGSDFLNDTYEKMMSNDYELSISRNEVIATEDKHYLVGYFTAKELLDGK